MKKTMRLFISMMMFVQLAIATEEKGLNQALDEYYYSVTVEWDQHDQAFIQLQEKRLQASIEELIKTGMTVDTLKAAFKERTNQDFDTLLNDINAHKMSNREDVRKYIEERLASNYSQGASWNGEALLPIAGILLVGIALSPLIWCMSVSTPGNSEC